MATLNFDAHEVDPNPGFEPIPAGEYAAAIVNSQMKPTKAGDGEYLELEFEIIDGPHKGRRLWDRLNLVNRSERAVQISRSTLSAICRAVNVMGPRDSVELHNIPLVVRVDLKKRADTGEMTNEIKGYAAMRRTEHIAAPAATDDRTPPWKR